MIYDILIVGGGPAGLTAAIYGCRSGKTVLILEKEGFGGQIAYSPRVENYPGLGSVSGLELSENMLSQAMEQGAETDVGTVNALRFENGLWIADTEEGERYEAGAVILAVGAGPRLLGLPGEAGLIGSGVSYCAVCDGDFFRDREVCVAGGGDSALQEALLLSDICSKVTLIHRREELRGEKALQERLFARSNMELKVPYEIAALQEENGALSALTLRNRTTGEEERFPTAALFVCWGHIPATGPFASLLETEDGYAVADENGATGVPGLFVAGDCRKKTVRQLTTALGDGAAAALSAVRYLDDHPAEEPLEIERKFLIRRPGEALLNAQPGEVWDIRQVYLLTDPTRGSRRVRRVRTGGEERWYYNEKVRITDLRRIEREREITREEAETLLREADPARRPIEKRRWRIPFEGRVLEVDLFPFWEKQAFCEVELDREDAPFVLPDWLEVLREVSGDRRYNNNSMARVIPEED